MTMLTFLVEEWMGNAAAVLSGVWGAVTQRSAQRGYSRTAIYQHAERVVQAVANEQAGGMSSGELWAEHERLKAENAALWQACCERGRWRLVHCQPQQQPAPQQHQSQGEGG